MRKIKQVEMREGVDKYEHEHEHEDDDEHEHEEENKHDYEHDYKVYALVLVASSEPMRRILQECMTIRYKDEVMRLLDREIYHDHKLFRVLINLGLLGQRKENDKEYKERGGRGRRRHYVYTTIKGIKALDEIEKAREWMQRVP